MTGLGAVLLQAEIDPSVVRPGWTPLLVTALLMLALVFLFLSMSKQLRKIHVPDDDQRADPESDAEDVERATAEPVDEAPERSPEAKASPPESR